jgi:hypothetical protein
MAAIEHVNKARKAQGPCHACNREIEAGSAYNWFRANRFSPRYAWHTDCPAPRGSVMESNEKRSTAMAAFEDAYDEVDRIRGKLDEYQTAPESYLEAQKGVDAPWTPETAAESLLGPYPRSVPMVSVALLRCGVNRPATSRMASASPPASRTR